ncbi:Type II secretion system protein E [compost metagenome]
MDDTLRAMILQKRSDSEYAAYARTQGFKTILEDGMDKACAGLTTISEVYRVSSNQ